jgi:hypothetical protein
MQRGLCLVVLAVASSALAVPVTNAPAKRPQPLPVEVVTAWERAGAMVGWVRRTNAGFLTGPRSGSEGKEGEIPWLQFDRWQAGVLKELPPLNQPFGMGLTGVEISDEELKELAVLKELQLLVLDSVLGCF